MNTPHERLTRTTFSLPLGEVHALVGGAVNARPLLFLHGFPDHPPTAVPFLEHLADTHRVVAPWLRGYAPSPIVDLHSELNQTPTPWQAKDFTYGGEHLLGQAVRSRSCTRWRQPDCVVRPYPHGNVTLTVESSQYYLTPAGRCSPVY